MSIRSLGALALVPLVACARQPAPPDAPPPSRACTEMGCVDGLHVSLKRQSAWPHGAYEFVVDVDGTAVTCRGALPLPACDDGPALTCTPADRVQITESGCALPAEQHGWGDLHIEGEPAVVKITLRQGETTLHGVELRPEYRTVQPNGPGCAPTCRQGSGAIELP